MPPKHHGPELKKMFDKIDTDNDGYVTKQEIRDFPNVKNMDEQKLKKLNKKLDKIEGDRLDKDQFKKAMKQAMKKKKSRSHSRSRSSSSGTDNDEDANESSNNKDKGEDKSDMKK